MVVSVFQEQTAECAQEHAGGVWIQRKESRE
jgi:hypothetical protein